jgi:hypothetical protein
MTLDEKNKTSSVYLPTISVTTPTPLFRGGEVIHVSPLPVVSTVIINKTPNKHQFSLDKTNRSRVHVLFGLSSEEQSSDPVSSEHGPKNCLQCRCDERLKSKDEGSTLLTYTGLRGELEHLQIKTRLIDERFTSVMGECVIVTLCGRLFLSL